MEAIISAADLTRTLEGEIPVTLVRDINLTINRGELVVITGPSGSGKSSLLYLLGLLDKPTKGSVNLAGKDTSLYNDQEIADVRLAQIGFIFQFHFLLPEFSALENVMLPMQRLGKLTPKEVRERAAKLLTDLGLAQQINNLPKQLSGGQSQRVAIARALANDPMLIMADEPTGNLDSAASMNVEEILRNLAHEHKRAVIIVSHESRIAQNADRLIHIVDGKLK